MVTSRSCYQLVPTVPGRAPAAKVICDNSSNTGPVALCCWVLFLIVMMIRHSDMAPPSTPRAVAIASPAAAVPCWCFSAFATASLKCYLTLLLLLSIPSYCCSSCHLVVFCCPAFLFHCCCWASSLLLLRMSLTSLQVIPLSLLPLPLQLLLLLLLLLLQHSNVSALSIHPMSQLSSLQMLLLLLV